MNGIRTFIALSMSSEIATRLEEVITQLKAELKDAPVRWVAPGNVHLTLKFLGNVRPSDIEALKDLLQTVAGRHASFDIRLGGLGAFPHLNRPRVIWVGIEAPSMLFALQQDIEDEVARLGFARENKKFSPHLTIGRVTDKAGAQDYNRLSQVLAHEKVDAIGALHVAHVDLYRSDLQPSGARYTRLVSAHLMNH